MQDFGDLEVLTYLSKIFRSIMNMNNPSRPTPGRRDKIKLNFYFHTSLWLRHLHKIFFRHRKEV